MTKGGKKIAKMSSRLRIAPVRVEDRFLPFVLGRFIHGGTAKEQVRDVRLALRALEADGMITYRDGVWWLTDEGLLVTHQSR